MEKAGLKNDPEPGSVNDTEVRLVFAAIHEHGGLKIGDMVRLMRLDIPQVYRALMSLRDKGSVELWGTSPIQYFLRKPKDKAVSLWTITEKMFPVTLDVLQDFNFQSDDR